MEIGVGDGATSAFLPLNRRGAAGEKERIKEWATAQPLHGEGKYSRSPLYGTDRKASEKTAIAFLHPNGESPQAGSHKRCCLSLPLCG